MVSNYEFRDPVLRFLRIVDKTGSGWQFHAAAVSGQVELFQNTSSRKKFEKDCPLFDLVRQEHVTLYNVQISQLYDLIKEYLKGLKLDIIHEENDEDYWDIKAHKGRVRVVLSLEM
jgi:CRISPR/Cas system CSM-associated protein Csm2 small subunit